MTKSGHPSNAPAPRISTPPVLTGGQDPVAAMAWRTTAQVEAVAPLMGQLTTFL
ncbi:MAG: hypothetical protein HY975_04215, partial [Candidatus Kerfeldbacteria bacterium]|nr:hypothetical protein [Candidatus Kerfeldbacteria bacterium]